MSFDEQRHLVLLHGMFGRADNWRACVERVPPGWDVSIPELPLFRGDARHDTVAGLSEYLFEYLDTRGITRVVLGGNSLGGHVALQSAIDRPDRVAGLVLAGSSGLFERGIVNRIPLHPDRDWVRTRVREVFHDDRHASEGIVDDVLDIVKDRGRARRILNVTKSTKRTNLGGLLHRIRCPVLLIWGAEDVVTPPSVALQFRESMPQAELHVIPRCGHVPMVEHPAEFARLLGGFLVRHFSSEFARPAALAQMAG